MPDQSVAIVTGSLGLVGAAASRMFRKLGLDVVGIDNDFRAVLFGPDASTRPMQKALEAGGTGYRHEDLDIRDRDGIARVFETYARRIAVVVHAAAQPSHDWAALDPMTDFEVNATATLGLLEAARRHAPEARFIFLSTNKVYGDQPNDLPLERLGARLDISRSHPFHARGIDETMPIDRTRHSLFGVSKTAADLMVQEYGARFGLPATVLRAGCITGEDHRGVPAHGFLSHLCRAAKSGRVYDVIGHGGYQVRDNLHAEDLALAFAAIVSRAPQAGVYNIGGGRASSVSVREALALAGEILHRTVATKETPASRYGDHAWWITDTRAFEADHPGWAPRHDARALIERLLGEA
ncbi:MAG: NAD-dependent epimerase/dehydratase family protein [Pseudomonadota bacterium]